MQRMHYVMHYVMHRVLAKMGWPSLDRVLSKMAEASLRSYREGSYKAIFTVRQSLSGYDVSYVGGSYLCF